MKWRSIKKIKWSCQIFDYYQDCQIFDDAATVAFLQHKIIKDKNILK